MHLEIKQANDRTEQVSSTCIDKLYNLSENGLLDATSDLRGNINATVAYEDAVTFLNTMWGPNLIVTASVYYIRFADPEVESVLKTALNKAEDEGITTQEASNTVANYFQNNTDIESFDELKYFKIGHYNFSGCTNLESVDITDKYGSFNNCTNLVNWYGGRKPDGYLYLGNPMSGAQSCPGLTELEIGEEAPDLWNGQFDGSKNIAILRCKPAANYQFGYPAFRFAPVKNVYIENMDNWLTCRTYGSGMMDSNTKIFYNDQLVTSVEVPQTITQIGGCFAEYRHLTSVQFHSDITSIATGTFNNCTNLVIADLNLPNLTSLGSYAFKGTKVQTISDLGSVTNIPEGCFKDCSQLTGVNMQSTITSIDGNAFNGCSNLAIQDLNLPNLLSLDTNAFLGTKIQVISDLGHITELKWGAFQSCTTLTTVTLPNGLTTIAVNAFQSCSSLSTVNLPSSVTNIGADGFNANSITTVNITDLDAWTNIDFNQAGSTPIKDNTQLLLNGNPVTTYSFPNDRTTIKKYCFYKVKSLTSITIPNSVTTISENAFCECSGLTSVTLPNSVTSIGYRAFRGCSGLTSISIPNSVTSISGQAFYGCAALTSITIPDNVTSDVYEWFPSCDTLTTVVLGSGITKIKAYAFRGDTALRSLTVKAVTPPVCENNAFAQSAITGYYNNYCDIYVPAGSVDAYKAADGWSAAASRIYAIPNS